MILVRDRKLTCKFVGSLQMDREFEMVVENVYKCMVQQLGQDEESAKAIIHKQVDSAIKDAERKMRKEEI